MRPLRGAVVGLALLPVLTVATSADPAAGQVAAVRAVVLPGATAAPPAPEPEPVSGEIAPTVEWVALPEGPASDRAERAATQPSSAISVTGRTVVGRRFRVSARFAPAFKGAPLVLQGRHAGDSWGRLARTTQDANGRGSFLGDVRGADVIDLRVVSRDRRGRSVATRAVRVRLRYPTKPVITRVAPPTAVRTRLYTAALSVDDGRPGEWSLVKGRLPKGLTFDANGMVRGRPSTAGSVSFTARFEDYAGDAATRSVTVAVATTPPSTCQELRTHPYPYLRAVTGASERSVTRYQIPDSLAVLEGALRIRYEPWAQPRWITYNEVDDHAASTCVVEADGPVTLTNAASPDFCDWNVSLDDASGSVRVTSYEDEGTETGKVDSGGTGGDGQSAEFSGAIHSIRLVASGGKPIRIRGAQVGGCTTRTYLRSRLLHQESTNRFWVMDDDGVSLVPAAQVACLARTNSVTEVDSAPEDFDQAPRACDATAPPADNRSVYEGGLIRDSSVIRVRDEDVLAGEPTWYTMGFNGLQELDRRGYDFLTKYGYTVDWGVPRADVLRLKRSPASFNAEGFPVLVPARG